MNYEKVMDERQRHVHDDDDTVDLLLYQCGRHIRRLRRNDHAGVPCI